MSKRKHTNRCNIGLGKALNEATCIYNLPSYIVANARGKEVQHILQDAPLVSSWEGASNVRLGPRMGKNITDLHLGREDLLTLTCA